MTKTELVQILRTTGVSVEEGEQYLNDKTYPKIAYWEYYWNDVMASGDDYEEIVTYQVSFVSRKPRDPALITLKRNLNDAGLHPQISHEYVAGTNGPGEHHSYFAVDIEESIT